MKLKKIIPWLGWLAEYQSSYLKGDLWAGLTVGVMLIPQSMAYALIAGLPPIFGLYAAFLPQVVYSFAGSSRHLSVAPSAMISLLIVAGISNLATPGTDDYVHLAVLLALLTGILQLLFAIVKFGFIVNFLSRPVISGYTSAAAIIIGLSQLKHLFNIEIPYSNLIPDIVRNIIHEKDSIQWISVLIGAMGIMVLLALKKVKRSLPGPLVVVVIGIIVTSLFHLPERGIEIVGAIPSGLPTVGLPRVGINDISGLLPLALLISLVGFMESVSIAKTIQAKKQNYDIVANRELAGLGLANITASLFGTFPVSGGLGRTAVNVDAGANTNLSSWISAVVVGITLLFLTPLFYYLPKAILASIVIVAAFGLIDYKIPVWLYRISKKDFLMLVVTFIVTLLFGVVAGILTGVVLSLIFLIYRSATPHIAQLGRLPGTDHYRNVSRFPEAVERDDLLIFRFDSELYFANAGYFKDRLMKMIAAKGHDLKAIILNAQSIHALDSSAIETLAEIVEDCQSRGVSFYITGAIGPVRDKLRKSGLYEKIGKDYFTMSIDEAIGHFDNCEKRAGIRS